MFFIVLNLILAVLCFLIIGHAFLLYRKNRHLNVFFVVILLFVSVPRIMIFIEGLKVKDIKNSLFWDNLNLAYIYVLIFQWFFKVLLNKKRVDGYSLLQIFFGLIFFMEGFVGWISPNWNRIIFICYSLLITGQLYFTVVNYIKEVKRLKVEDRIFINWLRLMFVAANLLLVNVFVIYFLNNKIDSVYIRAIYRFNTIVWFGVCLYILFNPLVLYGVNALQKTLLKPKLADLKLWVLPPKGPIQKADTALHQRIHLKIPFYLARINELVLKKKGVLVKGKVLKGLADLLQVPQSHIKYAFKYHCTLSVKEYENYLKVMMAIEYIEKQYLKEHTVASLAEVCGFASRSAFYDNFKKFAGEKVTEYTGQALMA